VVCILRLVFTAVLYNKALWLLTSANARVTIEQRIVPFRFACLVGDVQKKFNTDIVAQRDLLKESAYSSIPGIPNFSLTMYPFSISTDEHVPFKVPMTKRLNKMQKSTDILIELLDF